MTLLFAEAPLSLQPLRTFVPSHGPSPPAKLEETISHRSRSRVDLHVDSIRVRRILETEIEYVSHPSFGDPGAGDEILRPMPETAQAEGTRRAKPPRGS